MRKNKIMNFMHSNFIKKNSWRMLLSAALIAGVFVMPLLTESRYHAYLNGFAAVIAKEYYFSSNYMKEGGADYSMSWSGGSQVLNDIRVQNYENTLLANMEGQDLNYTMDWKVTSHAPDGTDVSSQYPYTLCVKTKSVANAGNPIITYGVGTEPIKGDGITETAYSNAQGSITYSIKGDGDAKQDIYEFTLMAPALGESASNMPNNYYTVVSLEAKNSGDNRNQYSKTIKADLRYNVTTLGQFVKGLDVTQSTDSKNCTFTVTTDTLSTEEATQRVYLWWDLSKFSVNRFNPQFNKLYMQGKYTTVSGEGGRQFGLLEINAASLSSYTYEYEKTEAFKEESGKYMTLTEEMKGNDISYSSAQAAGKYIGYYMEKEGSE